MPKVVCNRMYQLASNLVRLLAVWIPLLLLCAILYSLLKLKRSLTTQETHPIKQEVNSPMTDKELAQRIGFDEQVLSLVKKESKGQLMQLSYTDYVDYGRREVEVGRDAFFVSVPQDKSEELVYSLQSKLSPMGYITFIMEQNYAEKRDKIAVIKGTDPYEILRFMGTSGNDFPISNKDLVTKIKGWEKHCVFDILGANYDWVEIKFKTLPKDIDTFAKEVDRICPDEDSAYDPKIGAAKIAKTLRKAKRLFLWWD